MHTKQVQVYLNKFKCIPQNWPIDYLGHFNDHINHITI